MNTQKRRSIQHCLIAALAMVPLALTPFAANAQIHSKSGELVVMQPKDLPEEAQLGGNSFFLHADTEGNTFLYVEQQQGARLTTFNVTDPARIKLIATTRLSDAGPFDFVRPLDGRAELIRFRDGKGVAVLDLHKAMQPSLHMISGLLNPGPSEPLGESGYLGIDEPYSYTRAIPRDYQVVDIETPSDPLLLDTVKGVKHTVVNGETGTTFLLGADGLTVVRRISVENDYKNEQAQTSRN